MRAPGTGEGGGEGIERGRCCVQIAGRERLADRTKVRSAVRAVECLSILERSVLAESHQRVISLLRRSGIAGLESLPELCKISLALLIKPVALQGT